VLSVEQIEQIHQASLRILEEVGVEMLDRRALDLMASFGADVDWGDSRVRIPRELVQTAVSKAPSRFTLHGRNPERSVEIGGGDMVTAPVGGPSMVSSLDGGRRPGTYADQVNYLKLTHNSPLLDISYQCVEANDLPADSRHLDFLLAAILHSDKPIGVMTLDASRAVDVLKMAGLLFGGAEQLRDRPVVLAGVNVDSPLRFSRETLEAIIAFASVRQPLKITPFVLTGVMSPVTPAGALAQQNAEVLAGVVVAELVGPGTPVLYGSFGTEGNMRSAAPMFGRPGGIMMEVAAGQMARRYGLPHRGMGLVTSSPAVDAQAAMEKMNCLWALTLSNVDLLLQAAGWLEGGLTASYEQFVLDLEMLESMDQFRTGLAVNDVTLALDAVSQVGPGGSFLMADHTISLFREYCEVSPLMECRGYDLWQSDGAPSLLQKANSLWKAELDQYQRPPLDPGLEEALRGYVAQRKLAMRAN
jgi:trimethylamine---corrinoid protein Co-methyltransferase